MKLLQSRRKTQDTGSTEGSDLSLCYNLVAESVTALAVFKTGFSQCLTKLRLIQALLQVPMAGSREDFPRR